MKRKQPDKPLPKQQRSCLGISEPVLELHGDNGLNPLAEDGPLVQLQSSQDPADDRMNQASVTQAADLAHPLTDGATMSTSLDKLSLTGTTYIGYAAGTTNLAKPDVNHCAPQHSPHPTRHETTPFDDIVIPWMSIAAR